MLSILNADIEPIAEPGATATSWFGYPKKTPREATEGLHGFSYGPKGGGRCFAFAVSLIGPGASSSVTDVENWEQS
jgi:hypothetical protein